MPKRSSVLRGLATALPLIVAMSFGPGLFAGERLAEAPPATASGPAWYRVRTETSMPNLEENLRYATRIEERCVDPADLADQFWMTRDSALTDCVLEKTRQDAMTADYRLVCRGRHGAEGAARWAFDTNRMTGVLDLRLGGKNMTLSQRIVSERIGRCPPDQ